MQGYQGGSIQSTCPLDIPAICQDMNITITESSFSRLANRVLQLTKQEAENSEDAKYIATLNFSAEQLQSSESREFGAKKIDTKITFPVFSGVSPMVQFAKGVALNITDPVSINGWRKHGNLVRRFEF